MYEYCSGDLQKSLDIGRTEETKQLDEETKRMLESRSKEKDKEEEKVPLINKEEKKEEKEQLVADDILNMPFGMINMRYFRDWIGHWQISLNWSGHT